ncbi:hypothetical protein SO694_00025263 [Aureococcus anophagefferens]|uniref:Uncharacterized protein n=1 Tax=Aureococcus anophagefferens TaxID=44056 RepID=A0ABR1FV63_AURAN
MPTPLLWLLASASAFGPRTQQRAPLPPPPAASPMPVRVATGATGAAWVALGARTFDVESSRQLVGALGVATATFEDNIREPAAGFLELTSPVFGVVGPAVDLLFLTAAVAVKAVGASGVDDVAALLKGDAVDLATDRGESAGGGFYRTPRRSTGLGARRDPRRASFIFSPVNPIGIFETESAATHLFRAVCGIYIALVETGSKAFAELVAAQPDSPIVQMVNAGDAAAPPAVDDAPR